MITTRRSYTNARWARQDARWVIVYVLLLAGGAFSTPLFYAAVAVTIAVPAFFGIRYWRRVRRWKRDGPSEFWADRIKD